MQLRHAFPTDAASGACFLTKQHRLKEGEKIVDLDRDLEDMPPWGRLCLHPDAVRQMATCLGWTVVESGDDDKYRKLQTVNDELRAELSMLRRSLRDVLSAGELVGVEHPELESAVAE